MTVQQMQVVFDIVCERLAEQKNRSVDSAEQVCAYRGDNGVKCAIGHLIPDSIYNKYMEKVSVPYLCLNGMRSELAEYMLETYGIELRFGNEGLSFLADLQCAHDFGGHSILEELRDIAARYGLDDSKIGLFTSWEGHTFQPEH